MPNAYSNRILLKNDVAGLTYLYWLLSFVSRKRDNGTNPISPSSALIQWWDFHVKNQQEIKSTNLIGKNWRKECINRVAYSNNNSIQWVYERKRLVEIVDMKRTATGRLFVALECEKRLQGYNGSIRIWC